MMNEMCSEAPTIWRSDTPRRGMRGVDVEPCTLDVVEAWARDGARKLLRMANRYLRDQQDAEQVVRDVMLSALRAESEGDSEAAGETWLREQTLALTLRKLRSRPRRSEPSIDQLLPRFEPDGSRASEPAVHDRPDDEEIVAAMRRHIERLPELHRTAYLLKIVEGLDAQSIAHHLELDEPRVRRLLHEARLALCTLLARRGRRRTRGTYEEGLAWHVRSLQCCDGR